MVQYYSVWHVWFCFVRTNTNVIHWIFQQTEYPLITAFSCEALTSLAVFYQLFPDSNVS